MLGSENIQLKKNIEHCCHVTIENPILVHEGITFVIYLLNIPMKILGNQHQKHHVYSELQVSSLQFFQVI